MKVSKRIFLSKCQTVSQKIKSKSNILTMNPTTSYCFVVSNSFYFRIDEYQLRNEDEVKSTKVSNNPWFFFVIFFIKKPCWMKGKCYFCVINMKNIFWKILMDSPFSYTCTVHRLFGGKVKGIMVLVEKTHLIDTWALRLSMHQMMHA